MKPDWKANETLPVGKGATFQQWVATAGNDMLVMDVAPWGEGHLKVNGREIAHINDAKDRRGAFRELNKIAERYLEGQVIESATGKSSSMILS
jgi:enoyl-[acyl-carrier protein] reductase I